MILKFFVIIVGVKHPIDHETRQFFFCLAIMNENSPKTLSNVGLGNHGYQTFESRQVVKHNLGAIFSKLQRSIPCSRPRCQTQYTWKE